LISRAQEKLGQQDTLELLDAVRVMSIGWIVLYHTYDQYFVLRILSNFSELLNIISDYKYTLPYSGFFAVDTFFWLSGFLMSYFFIIEVEKSMSLGKFGMVYIHRFLRITPMYMIVLCFFWTMTKYIGNGPLWINVENDFTGCEDYWYSNLIYINNFLLYWKSNYCLEVSWSLAVDMQFFWISPVILILYTKVNKGIGWILIGFLCALNILYAGLMAYQFRLNPYFYSLDNENNNYYYYYYTKPCCRVGPYALGVACGLIIYSYRKYQKTGEIYDSFAVAIGKLQENKVIRRVTFLFGLVLINFILFSLYEIVKNPEGGHYSSWSQNKNIAFIAFERVAFGLGISMILLPMLLGHFKGITKFLCLYPWSLMSRLSFGVYLIHFDIIQIVIHSQKKAFTFEIYKIIEHTIYFFILSTFFAALVVLLIELPFTNLEKLIFKPASPKKLENGNHRKKKLS
jgi:peptidoglycan/LPS O-acetylase OafA/YrhL